jgi:hypothetical protein
LVKVNAGRKDNIMQIPQMTPVASIVPLTSFDATLHQLVGVSWHVLIPYTVLGAGLMTYSQARLVRGQRALGQAGKKAKPKSRSTKR